MGLLSKIALALAFLAAFAIPWLGATARGAVVNGGPAMIAASSDVEEPAGSEAEEPVINEVTPEEGEDSDLDYEEAYPNEPLGEGQFEEGNPEPGSQAPEGGSHQGHH
jgi:hypothetical protein